MAHSLHSLHLKFFTFNLVLMIDIYVTLFSVITYSILISTIGLWPWAL